MRAVRGLPADLSTDKPPTNERLAPTGHAFALPGLVARVLGQYGIPGLTFQALRRTFATLVQDKGTLKDVQAQLRHADAATTLGIYMQSIPDSVAEAVEALDRELAEVDKGVTQ